MTFREKSSLSASHVMFGLPGVKKTMVWSPETRLNWYFWHFWNSQKLHFFIKKSSFFWTILTPNVINKLVSTLIFWRPEMHHPVSYDILVGLKILRAKVIKGISRNLQNTTEKIYIRAGPEEPQKTLAPYYFQREKFPLCKSCDVWGGLGWKKQWFEARRRV